MAEIKGGEKMARALADIGRKLGSKSSLAVGFMEGATEADGTSIPMVAAIQNFGAPSRGIPPRPFFSNMVAAKQGEWAPALGRLLEANDFDAVRSLEVLGEGIAGQLKQSILDTNEPPLAPATIRRKGFVKPLVDTGSMLNAITSRVTR